MKVPCYTVKGKAGRLEHVWNEILLEDGSILDLDISKQNNRVLRDQRELTICTSKVVDNKKIWTIG